MRFLTIMRTVALAFMLIPTLLSAQGGAPPRALYFSFYYAPPPLIVTVGSPAFCLRLLHRFHYHYF